MSKRRFERRYDLTLERTVDYKAVSLWLGDHRGRRATPVIGADRSASTLTLAGGIWVGRFDPGVLPGHQLYNSRCRPQIDELSQHVGHPRQRIDEIQLAGLNERGGDCPVLRTHVVPGEECVLPRQCKRTHRALNRIGINLDAAIVEKEDKPLPVVETVADVLGKRRTLGDFDKALLKPWLQRRDDGLRARLPLGTAHLRGAAADLRLDRIELADAHKRLGRDRCIASYVDLVELPSQMAPTKGERHRTAGTADTCQLVIAGVAVDLQHAAEAFKKRDGVFLASPWRISVGNRRRLRAAPGPIVARNRPQEAGLGLAPPRIEHGATRLVGKQLRRALELAEQVLVKRFQLGSCRSDPLRKRGALNMDPVSRQDLRLPVQRQVIGVLGDHHIGNERFRQKTALDQAGWRRRLYHAIGTLPAGILRSARDDHPDLGWNLVQPP